jgi:hypothetical protein
VNRIDSECCKNLLSGEKHLRALTQAMKHITIAFTSLALVSCACSGESKSTDPTVKSGIADASSETLTSPGCMRTGCSNHRGTEQGEAVVSTCQWKEEYACYKTARCEKQANGKCGWSESSELTSCLKAATEKQQDLLLPPQ